MAETNGQTSVDRSTEESPSSSGVQDPGPCYFMVVDIWVFPRSSRILTVKSKRGALQTGFSWWMPPGQMRG